VGAEVVADTKIDTIGTGTEITEATGQDDEIVIVMAIVEAVVVASNLQDKTGPRMAFRMFLLPLGQSVARAHLEAPLQVMLP